MPKINVGVIGTGSIGNVHLTGYAAAARHINIAAICDVTPSRLKEMGDKYGVAPEHRYRDYNEMLANEDLQAVSVCVPNKFHFEAAAAAVKSGCDLLLEKPVVLTMDEARRMRQLLKKHPVKFMVAFSHRFSLPNIAAKKLLDKGTIGKPYSIRVRFAHTGPYPGWAKGDWFYKPAIAGGGAVLDMGIHAIDICQNLVGPIQTVQAEVKTLRKKIRVDDNAFMLVDFGREAACIGSIEVGWTSPAGFAGIEIFGDKGSISLPMGEAGIVTRGVRRPDGTAEMQTRPVVDDPGDGNWPNQMEQWVRYLRGVKPTTHIPGWDEGESALAVSIAAAQSSKTGRRVKVKR